MKVLLIGSGGREHALFWKLSQSPKLSQLDVFPGNGGIPESSIITITTEGGKPATMQNIQEIAQYIKKTGYDLVVVGPEQPLVDGLADALEAVCPVFGPSRKAAALEGSKDFSKSFMNRHKIPTAKSRTFSDLNEALQYLESNPAPIVIKADGLAAGKGVTVAMSQEEAVEAVRDALERDKFGISGNRVLIEEFMDGEEASVFAFCDGERISHFIAAQDFKRAYDGNRGPNTGGMGAYAPVPFMTSDIMNRVRKEILEPVVKGMAEEGHPYRGLLYAGLMVKDGVPRVVEFNCRFGDPETQPLMLLLDEDILDLFYRSATGTLEDRPLKFHSGTAITVVISADGYPGTYQKDIDLGTLSLEGENPVIFHAGTRKDQGRYYSTGGRILNITGRGKDHDEARKNVYAVVEKLNVPGIFYRKDIGLKHS